MLRKTRTAAILAGLTLTLGLTPAMAQPIQVGAIEILTGPNAAYGTSIKAGLELALDEHVL
jgi:branched-chain amino acid transport system substrate-binding protein